VTETVRIRGIAAGGDGVGALGDGLTVFVPRAAPDELVEIDVETRQRSFARGGIRRILEPSVARVEPRCPHYDGDSCGGCQLQHLERGAQREVRRRIVSDALRRIGHLDVDVPAVQPAPDDWEYRTRITLAVKGNRIGFHRVGRPGSVFDLVRCHIARPELQSLWSAARRHRALLPDDVESVVLRVDRRGGRHLIARTAGKGVWTSARRLGDALTRDGSPAVLWWQPAHGAPRTVAGASEVYPAIVFEQVNPMMGDQVRAHAVGELGEMRGLRAWDLYAGIGETTAAIAALGARVDSVEVDPRAVAAAEKAGPVEGIARHAGLVEEVIPRLSPADVVVVNPPRTGLGTEVTTHLSARLPARLVYISCDPATLARDAARLAPVLRLSRVRAFDLFPQTSHVETVARFDRP
jgi:23S rRNA (uracil1939-C5)-methyltransferase